MKAVRISTLAAVAWIASTALLISPANGQTKGQPKLPVAILLDGSERPVAGLTIRDGKLSADGWNEPVSLDELRQIRLRPPAAVQTGGIEITTVGQGRLTATSVSIAGDDCKIATQQAGELTLPIDVIRSVAFDAANLPADFQKAVETPSADVDRLFIRQDKTVESIGGLIDSLDKAEVKFEHDGEIRTQPRERLLGIVFAAAIAGDDLPSATVTFADGGKLNGEVIAVDQGRLSFKVGSSDVQVPLTAVQSITLRSPRLAFLSDMKPVTELQQAIVTLPRPWGRDRSYSGKPLTLGQRTFEKGIGAHSRSLLTFDLDAKFDQFAAIVGIDAATEGKGDCVMSVVVDGNPVWTERVKGSDPPREVKVDIAGVRQLTLVVEPGEELDLADHANWADARVIRNTK